MAKFEQHIRGQRVIRTVHGEAFQLMLYVAEDGSQAWFWNSRDGVTPFGTAIDGKEYRHAMRGYPTDYFSALPDKAEFIWVSYDRDSWEQLQRRKHASFSDRQDEYGAHFRSRFPTVEAWLAVAPFEFGQPRQVTREQFLTETPEWMGGVAPQESFEQ